MLLKDKMSNLGPISLTAHPPLSTTVSYGTMEITKSEENGPVKKITFTYDGGFIRDEMNNEEGSKIFWSSVAYMRIQSLSYENPIKWVRFTFGPEKENRYIHVSEENVISFGTNYKPKEDALEFWNTAQKLSHLEKEYQDTIYIIDE
jgi:hypothetical protein